MKPTYLVRVYYYKLINGEWYREVVTVKTENTQWKN